MRYLIHKKFLDEVPHRKQYIEEITRVYFYRTQQIGDFIVLTSFPSTYKNDICIIVAHNNAVAEFLNSSNQIKETNIFIISCSFYFERFYKISGKNIYLSEQKSGFSQRKSAAEYGFDFDITDTEINLYNLDKNIDIYNRLAMSFNKLF